MKILITGDSHTGAIARGLQMLEKEGSSSYGDIVMVKPLGGGHLLPTPFFRDVGSHAEIVDPIYKKHFSQLPPLSLSVDAIGLSMPLWPMRVIHKIVWGHSSLAESLNGRTPISHAVFRQMVLSDQAYVLRLAELLKRLNIPVAAVSGPGLFADHATLRHLNPVHVLGIFNEYREIMLSELRSREISVIDVPSECLGDDGFMRAEFRHEDPEDEHHANADFGAKIIQKIVEWRNGIADITKQ